MALCDRPFSVKMIDKQLSVMPKKLSRCLSFEHNAYYDNKELTAAHNIAIIFFRNCAAL